MLREPGWEATLAWLGKQPHLRLSTASLVEIHAVITNRSREPFAYNLDELLEQFNVELVSFDAGQAQFARNAYSRFGRGSGHRARLNFGDVIVYALSKSAGEPLAFVGDDFNHTDLETVRLPL